MRWVISMLALPLRPSVGLPILGAAREATPESEPGATSGRTRPDV